MERETKGKQKTEIRRTDSKTIGQYKEVILTGNRTCYKASMNKTVNCSPMYGQKYLPNRTENPKFGLSLYNNVRYL